MPTTKRVRRHARSSRIVAPGSHRWELLMYGFELLDSDEPGFESEAEERAAWSANRAELLAAAEPGWRPWAYLRFELRLERPPCRKRELLRLQIEHELISKPDAVAIERNDALLAPDAGVQFSGFETLAGIRNACGNGGRPSASFFQ